MSRGIFDDLATLLDQVSLYLVLLKPWQFNYLVIDFYQPVLVGLSEQPNEHGWSVANYKGLRCIGLTAFLTTVSDALGLS